MESKYLSRFKNVSVPLRGNRLLVEVLPKEEIKSSGGLIMATPKDHRTSTEQNRGTVAVVLAVGSGYFDEKTGEDVPLDIKPGAVILCSDMGFKYYSQFPGIKEYTSETIALTRDTEVHVAWPSLEVFEEYKKSLTVPA